LLDSYETERIPVAERLLRTTDRLFSVIVSDRLLAGLFPTRVIAKLLAVAMSRDRTRELAFRTISQIGIRYRKSLLSETPADLPDGAPRAGDRFPWLRLKKSPGTPTEDLFAKLDDTRFNLVVVGQPPLPDGPADHDDLVLTHWVPDDPVNDQELTRARIPKPAFYLLRPDGHVGLADAAALTRYLAERLGIDGGRPRRPAAWA
jgi:hypothetical protein